MHTQFVTLDSVSQLSTLFGAIDGHIRTIENELEVLVSCKNSGIEVKGEPDNVARAVQTIEALKRMIENNETIDDIAVSLAMDMVVDGRTDAAIAAMKDVIAITHKGKPIKCKTLGQKQYVRAMTEETISVCIGPAGSGKTYLAIAMAVNALRRKEVERIILTRPAVEAGEKLGFLPGDLQSKVDPYLRPLYDALYDFLGQETVKRYIENGTIEIAPVAYLRGRTLNNSFCIVDESQNLNLHSILMILTRLGEESRMVLTGDITQIDLPNRQDSGLKPCANILKGIEDVAVVHLNEKDVVRHKLVKEIVKAFEKYENRSKSLSKGK